MKQGVVMGSIWVVVADSSRARIFTAEKPLGEMTEIQTLAHPEARLHEGDLVSDKAGRERDTGYTSHDLGGDSGAKQEEEGRFAGILSRTLESGRTKGKFKKLYIIAAPGFLGSLRKQLSSALQKTVRAEISKNLTTHPLDAIRGHLPDRL